MNLLLEFFRHNTMMNAQMLEVCRALPPEHLGATVSGTYGSIGATLVHVANSQQSYAARLLDTDRSPRLAEDPFPGFAALAERFAGGNADLERAVQLADQDDEVLVTGDDPPQVWRMPRGLFLLQAINHGTEHRSQLATILTQIGVEPPNMDGWTFFEASGQLIPE